MRGKLFLSVFLLVWGFFLADAQQSDNPLSLQAMNISSQLREQLINSQQYLNELETRSNLLQQKLTESENLRDMQEAELQTLSGSLMNTMNSFRSLSIELHNLNMQSAILNERIQRQNRIIRWFGVIGSFIVLGKITGFVLLKKGVRLPAWLKLLL